MNILDLLDRPIAYHRVFATLTGSVKAAVMLSQAVYWQKRAKQADGWWYKSAEEWEEETGLTRHEQDTARKAFEKYLKSDLRGVPATLHWKVADEALSADLFALNSQSSLPKSVKLVSGKASNINMNTETTTETTTETRDILDGILKYQLKPKAIQDSIKENFKLTPNWETKFNRQFLQWAIQEQITCEQIKHAAQVWGSDKKFNWAYPNLKGIQEQWLQLIGGINATTPNRQPNAAIDPGQLERDRATVERIKARRARQQASV